MLSMLTDMFNLTSRSQEWTSSRELPLAQAPLLHAPIGCNCTDVQPHVHSLPLIWARCPYQHKHTAVSNSDDVIFMHSTRTHTYTHKHTSHTAVLTLDHTGTFPKPTAAHLCTAHWGLCSDAPPVSNACISSARVRVHLHNQDQTGSRAGTEEDQQRRGGAWLQHNLCCPS